MEQPSSHYIKRFTKHKDSHQIIFSYERSPTKEINEDVNNVIAGNVNSNVRDESINVSDDVNTDVKNKDVNNSNANDNTYNHDILNSNDIDQIDIDVDNNATKVNHN